MRKDLTHINYVSCPACLTMFKPKTVPKHNDDNIKCICCHYIFLLSESIIYRNKSAKSKNTGSKLRWIFGSKKQNNNKTKASIPNFIADEKKQKAEKSFRRKAVLMSWMSVFVVILVSFAVNSLRLAIRNDSTDFFAKSSSFDLNKAYVYTDPEKYDNYYDAQYDYEIRSTASLSGDLDATVKLNAENNKKSEHPQQAELEPESAQNIQHQATDNSQAQLVLEKPFKQLPKFTCEGDNCHDYIAESIAGPELLKLDILGQPQLVMRSPLSRRDYYNYCYIDKKCSIGSQFEEQEFTKCLLEGQCSDNLVMWLGEPMEFISSYQVNEYLKWLNSTTTADYNIISDGLWAAMASKLNANSNCLISLDNNFKVSNNYSEWVKINDTIAFREPINLISESSQCQSNIKLADADNHFGKVVVRLSKTS